MSDPKRLLSTIGDEHEIERSLLRGLRDVEAPLDAKAETWTRLQAQLATSAVVAAGTLAAKTASEAGVGSTAAAGTASTHGGQAATALRALTMKIGLGALTVGSLLTGVVALWPRQHPTNNSRSTAPAVSVTVPTVTPPNRVTLTEPIPAIPNPSGGRATIQDTIVIHSKGAGLADKSDPLSVEAAMIAKARAQLRGGDATAALATLGRLQSRSHNGALGQEREVLTIQALSALGQTEAAQRRARAFVSNCPDSPHASQLRAIAGGR